MRNFLHYLISILLWVLFGYYWYVVVQRQIDRDTLQPLAILFAITALGLAITLWWIAHNKRIAAKGQPEDLHARAHRALRIRQPEPAHRRRLAWTCSRPPAE